tara:strand:- start:1600 stop:2721 length:1122 start_codon:yes stop_codon:yes gene_type:complete
MKNNRIFLSPPDMSEKEKKLINKAFDSNWIAPLGPNVDFFENELEKYLDVKKACALSSGTASLHLAIRILNIKKGDKVLCPSLTFAASANAIMYEQATPIFIDVDRFNWVVDCNLLEDAIKKHKPKAIITVDLYGNSCNYDELIPLCKKYNVAVIQDSAEALGSVYSNKKLGSFGDIGILSFNGNKIITTSGGGALVSQNDEYVIKAKFLATQAKENKIYYEHRELGYNYRMSNLLASVGRGQLERLDSFVLKRRNIFEYYYNSLSMVNGVRFLSETLKCNSNRWLTVLTLKNRRIRDEIIKILDSENIESRPVWKPMHLQPFYEKNLFLYDKSDNSRKIFNNGICLPSGSSLQKSEQGRIIDIILDCLNEYN